MVESEFERLGRTISLMVERFSRLKEERNALAIRLEQSEKAVTDLRRQVEELNRRKSQARGRLEGLLSRLDNLDI